MEEDRVAELQARVRDLQARVSRLEAWNAALEDGVKNMVHSITGDRVLLTPTHIARLAAAKGRG